MYWYSEIYIYTYIGTTSSLAHTGIQLRCITQKLKLGITHDIIIREVSPLLQFYYVYIWWYVGRQRATVYVMYRNALYIPEAA